MILVEYEPLLPHLVQDAKLKVLHSLRTMHALQEFLTVKELVDFLEGEVLDGLAAAGYPRSLSRVLLFCRTDQAAVEVAKRMHMGGSFYRWTAPACWLALHRTHGRDLRRWAQQIDPHFAAELPQGML